jgi:hypothetical protein
MSGGSQTRLVYVEESKNLAPFWVTALAGNKNNLFYASFWYFRAGYSQKHARCNNFG